MTPKERILVAIRGGQPDQIPFTIYERGIVSCGELERRLRNKGMGLVQPWYPVYKTEYPNVMFERKDCWEGNQPKIRETIKTPKGEVWQTLQTGKTHGSDWIRDFYIKDSDDYKVIEFMVRDAVYHPNYEGFLKSEGELGEDGILTAGMERSPLQKMLIELMGMERFSFDLLDKKTEFYSLYETILEKQRELFEIVTNSPAEVIHCGDNITGEVIGPERFSYYYLPWYNELARLLHKKGKYLAVHMDGKLANLKEVIGRTKIDIIEAFTPPPNGNLFLKEARFLWKDKVIRINFTSSIHLCSPKEIRAHMISLLREVVPGDRFLVGITENIPETVLEKNLRVISQTLQEKGVLPLHFSQG